MVKCTHNRAGDIITNITKEEMNKIAFCLKWFYHANKPKTKAHKAEFQKCKIIEEIGELGQAFALGKWKPKKYSSYEEVRGSIESELADVCIAVLGYLQMTGRQVLVFEDLLPLTYSEDVLMFKLLNYASDEEFCKLFNLICSFSIDNGIDILYNIRERLKFNYTRAARYRDGLNRRQIKEERNGQC